MSTDSAATPIEEASSRLSTARVIEEGTRDDEALALQVPSDGSVAFLRAVLSRLEAGSVSVAALSVDTPDLDDVFLTLTGHPEMEDDPR